MPQCGLVADLFILCTTNVWQMFAYAKKSRYQQRGMRCATTAPTINEKKILFDKYFYTLICTEDAGRILTKHILMYFEQEEIKENFLAKMVNSFFSMA